MRNTPSPSKNQHKIIQNHSTNFLSSQTSYLDTLCIEQPLYIHSLEPPTFTQDAFQTLEINNQMIEHQSNQNLEHSQQLNSRYRIQEALSKSQIKHEEQSKDQKMSQMFSENEQLKKQVNLLNQIIEEQKTKYAQLRDIYKEGEVMYNLIEQRNIGLEKEIKSLRQYIDYLKSETGQHSFDISKSRASSTTSKQKVQKIKVGPRKVPVIKVNVPPQTFSTQDLTMKQTENSVNQYSKAKFSQKDAEIQRLRAEVSQLKSEINILEIKLSQNAENHQRSHESNSNDQNKIRIMNEEIKKKDQMIKNLYDQCYHLQFNLDKVKTAQNNAQEQNKLQQTIQKLELKNEQLTIYSKNLMENCSKAIEELRNENRQYQQKVYNMDFEVKRLYKILQNKNAELGEMYSNMKESRKWHQQLQNSHQKNSQSGYYRFEQENANSGQKSKEPSTFHSNYDKRASGSKRQY